MQSGRRWQIEDWFSVAKWPIFVLCCALGLWLRLYGIGEIALYPQETPVLRGAVGILETGRFELWDFRTQETVAPVQEDRLSVAMVAASYHAFGVSEFATRIPSMLWGLLLVGALFILGYSLQQKLWHGMMLATFGLFFDDFIGASRIAPANILYVVAGVLGYTGLLYSGWKRWVGALGVVVAIVGSLLYFDVNILWWWPNPLIGLRIWVFWLFQDMRILWLAMIPVILWLYQRPWKKNFGIEERFIALLLLSFTLTAVLFEPKGGVPILVATIPLWWVACILSIDFLLPKKLSVREPAVAALVALCGIVPAIPHVPAIPVLTQEDMYAKEIERNSIESIQNLYVYIEQNPLDVAHLVRPNQYYVEQYTLNYAKHTGPNKYKPKSLVRYMKKHNTGYLTFPANANDSIPRKTVPLLEYMNYHEDISLRTGIEVYSWNKEQAAQIKEIVESYE